MCNQVQHSSLKILATSFRHLFSVKCFCGKSHYFQGQRKVSLCYLLQTKTGIFLCSASYIDNQKYSVVIAAVGQYLVLSCVTGSPEISSKHGAINTFLKPRIFKFLYMLHVIFSSHSHSFFSESPWKQTQIQPRFQYRKELRWTA